MSSIIKSDFTPVRITGKPIKKLQNTKIQGNNVDFSSGKEYTRLIITKKDVKEEVTNNLT